MLGRIASLMKKGDMESIESKKDIFSKLSFENNIILLSVRRGLTFMIPPLLVGSFALIFLSFPVQAYQEFMESVFGSQWSNIFRYVRDGTFNIMSLIMVICVSYSYAYETEKARNLTVNPIIVAVVSLCSFIALSGMSNPTFSIANFGAIGVFFAIVVAIIASWLFIKLCSYKFLNIRTFTEGADFAFNYALSSIFPAAVTILFFAVVSQVLSGLLGITDLQSLISNFFSGLFAKMGYSLGSGVLFIFIIHFFWFFGMHGSNILEPVSQSIFVLALQTNENLVARGLPPTEILTKTFFDNFVLMGGCGSTLSLILAIFICGRYKNLRNHAKLSVFPSLFNINELIVFGIPIVLNPLYFIPFLFLPVLLTVVSYGAMYYGLVPYTTTMVEWTTPILLSGYTSTGSISGSLLQLVNLSLGILCYLPFVKLSENRIAKQVKQNIRELYDMFVSNEQQGISSAFLTRRDDKGNTARFLIADLEHDLQNNKLALFYQPQADYEGKIIGAEALLRWKHDTYGYIYPPLVIALAEEAQLMDKLGYWILDTACGDLKKLNALGFENMAISVNISARQLESDSFLDNLNEIIKRQQAPTDLLKMEITEQLALAGSKNVRDKLKAIKDLGIKLAMDDFGMGHSSLMYLKEYEFDTIKLDGALIKEIVTNHTCRDIISSIIFLSRSLYFSVVAEYVESEEQRELLYGLGCTQYQGYLYSPAIAYAELVSYLHKQS